MRRPFATTRSAVSGFFGAAYRFVLRVGAGLVGAVVWVLDAITSVVEGIGNLVTGFGALAGSVWFIVQNRFDRGRARAWRMVRAAAAPPSRVARRVGAPVIDPMVRRFGPPFDEARHALTPHWVKVVGVGRIAKREVKGWISFWFFMPYRFIRRIWRMVIWFVDLPSYLVRLARIGWFWLRGTPGEVRGMIKERVRWLLGLPWVFADIVIRLVGLIWELIRHPRSGLAHVRRSWEKRRPIMRTVRWVRRHRVLTVLGVGAVMMIAATVARSGDTVDPIYAVELSAGPLTFDVPERWPAGEFLVVTVDAPEAPAGAEARLNVLTAHGAHRAFGEVENGQVRFEIPAAITARRGIVDLRVQIMASLVAARTHIEPGEAVDPIIPIVGQRSIRADGRDRAMVVTMPEDRFSNATADATVVEYRHRHPDQVVDVWYEETEYFLAWTWTTSRLTSGRGWIVVSSESAEGPGKQLVEVPAKPELVELTVRTLDRTGDGATLLSVSTNVLEDVNDNILLDGSYIEFFAEEPDGELRVFPGQTIDGVATVLVEAPPGIGGMSIWAAIAGEVSDSISLDFVTSLEIDTFPIEVRNTPDDLIVKVGPVIGELGQLLRDGSDAIVHVIDADGYELRSVDETEFGEASVRFRTRALAPGPIEVRVTVNDITVETTYMLEP